MNILYASKNSKFVEKIFVSTDCPKIKNFKKYHAEILERPKKLATKILREDVYKFAFEQIEQKLSKKIK